MWRAREGPLIKSFLAQRGLMPKEGEEPAQGHTAGQEAARPLAPDLTFFLWSLGQEPWPEWEVATGAGYWVGPLPGGP